MKKMFASLLLVSMATLFGCGGSGGGTPAQTTALSGAVTFPSANNVAKVVAGVVVTPTLEIRDLAGALVASPILTLQAGAINTYTYPATNLDKSKDYVLKAVNGSMVLRALINKASLADASTSQSVNNVTTTAVIVIEKSLTLTPGALGQTAITIPEQAAFALTPSSTTIVNNITAALTACTTTGTATPAQAQLASLANTVEAAVINNVDPAAFVAGTLTTTTITATTYAVSGTGTVTTSSNASITPTSAGTFAASSLPQFSSASSTTFTVGTASTFTVTGTGTFSVSGALPSGISFNATTGVLSGAPAAGSNGTYPLTFKAANNGFTVTQTFTLTIIPAAAPASVSIIGTWGGYGDPAVQSIVFSFVDSTHYMMIQSGPKDTGGQTGLEFGTYSWNSATGTGTLTGQLFDTNGDWGASNPPSGTTYTLAVSGDTLTIGNTVEGNSQASRLKSDPATPMVGGWWKPFVDAATGKPGGVLLVFFDANHCLLAQAGNDQIDTTGQSGIELGAYTVNAQNVMTTSLVVDTNGQWGLSNPPSGSTSSVSVSGNTLSINNSSEGIFSLTRVQ